MCIVIVIKLKLHNSCACPRAYVRIQKKKDKIIFFLVVIAQKNGSVHNNNIIIETINIKIDIAIIGKKQDL